ncbi:IlvE Branched-chain amino acid aminotransferase 4-amino-4-deoxychorismate lyase [Pyrenophora tritici-repentis]|uniref:Branched-chain-amino-acid aminotransferase 5 n=3 Tax=Pyrenophora tritici-repentis TaxID=45151 RepID=B2WPB1_PYRTR|nr:branched-chain-amino-acid aminotransferase 5 [Pyrenophora tritici-repentis Pt-1C-BFP]XP_001942165.1 branched-chain-amino-acid aminotransferase 5 [Pyrenophora tritici-repentis Pt-1C-BFP]XP_001942404.1 branched-chain-amino-acid aminotransferase 5 [Pyrenophora tritici-repentis Pt-1C-BFP]KAA8617246.1 Branched-chain-amino-acid aminotransferase 1 [Pyrenophora tritici-repentis]EDU45977.1 branched-chain-amino-acid aminotransferase 5 [Pyrenophora tritici-repentis Pt-1C-BFP]EDU45990.1 branched-chain-
MSGFPPPPVATIDWNKADNNRQVYEVNGHIESTYSKTTGEWTPLKFVSDPYMRVHGMSPALNYGQQALEGFKAFRTPGDPGRIVLFRPNLNAIRFQHSSIVLSMPPVPVEMFLRACRAAVALNANYVPPYESGGALYVRPQLYGTSAHLGLSAPSEYTFCVFVVPTTCAHLGTQPVKALILDDFDRAAPKGTGHAKVGGNYAPVIRWSDKARAEGFGITLHLDSVHHKEVDEFSSCAFIGVHSQGDSNITLVVPDSRCTIDSVTSDSVQHIAQQLGWKVEKRPVDYKELPSFSEVLGVGTSVVLIPIKSITRRSITQGMPSTPRLQVEAESEIITYLSEEQNKGGLVFSTLLNQLSAIQRGKAYDEFGWLFTVHEEDRNI